MPAGNRPNIEGIPICSAQGEVLHEWRCAELDQWIKFLEFVSQKAQRLAQGVALGEFDRLEILQEDSRILVIIAADRGVMIRTTREGGASPDRVSVQRRASRFAVSEETKEQLANWPRRAPSVRGVLVRGVGFTDQTITCDLDSRDFPVSALEQAARSAADTFQVLNAQRLFTSTVRCFPAASDANLSSPHVAPSSVVTARTERTLLNGTRHTIRTSEAGVTLSSNGESRCTSRFSRWTTVAFFRSRTMPRTVAGSLATTDQWAVRTTPPQRGASPQTNERRPLENECVRPCSNISSGPVK
ncbi:MAG: hypothetical protein MUF81_05270 [Verrucomicrobia bacterium]|nr:hypothetical protein [Verrucomicrobiota bacterium]